MDNSKGEQDVLREETEEELKMEKETNPHESESTATLKSTEQARDYPPVKFSVTSEDNEPEAESTPMLGTHTENGKLQYRLNDLEVVEVVGVYLNEIESKFLFLFKKLKCFR